MPDSSLTAIVKKVRRLTRNPSAQQLSDADILEYVNTFYVQDFPNWCKTRKLHSNFTAFTVPFTDFIPLPENLVLEINTPMYVNGSKVYYTQSQNEFFSLYPQLDYNLQIATGDGVTTAFQSGVAGVPLITNAPFLISTASTVSITSIDGAGFPLVAQDDVPNRVNYTAVPLIGDCLAGSTLNYLTGAFNITFTNPPLDGAPIFASGQPVSYGQPDTILYFDSNLYFRPVSSTPLEVKIEQDTVNTDLDTVFNDTPLLEQWWQYIAYGAAIKVLQDKVDMETAALLTPEFKNQERLVMRRVLNQLSQQRASTRYVANALSGGYGWPYLQN